MEKTYFADVLYFVQKKVEIICKLVYNPVFDT